MGTNLITSKTENSHERTLNSLIEMREENKDLLYQFSLFISNNPDYKYNSTYLLDEIDFFLKSKNIFNEKIKFFRKLIKNLKKLNSNQKDIKIIFDNVFEFNLTTVNEKTYDFDNLYFKEFKFNCIGTTKIVVKFIYKKIIRSYEIKDFTSDKSVLEINKKFKLLLDKIN